MGSIAQDLQQEKAESARQHECNLMAAEEILQVKLQAGAAAEDIEQLEQDKVQLEHKCEETVAACNAQLEKTIQHCEQVVEGVRQEAADQKTQLEGVIQEKENEILADGRVKALFEGIAVLEDQIRNPPKKVTPVNDGELFTCNACFSKFVLSDHKPAHLLLPKMIQQKLHKLLALEREKQAMLDAAAIADATPDNEIAIPGLQQFQFPLKSDKLPCQRRAKPKKQIDLTRLTQSIERSHADKPDAASEILEDIIGHESLANSRCQQVKAGTTGTTSFDMTECQARALLKEVHAIAATQLHNGITGKTKRRGSDLNPRDFKDSNLIFSRGAGVNNRTLPNVLSRPSSAFLSGKIDTNIEDVLGSADFWAHAAKQAVKGPGYLATSINEVVTSAIDRHFLDNPPTTLANIPWPGSRAPSKQLHHAILGHLAQSTHYRRSHA